MGKYVKKSIVCKEYNDGTIKRYEILWVKQHSFFGIMLNKYSETKDRITFDNVEIAKEYINNVSEPVTVVSNHCSNEYYCYVNGSKIAIHFKTGISSIDRFLFNSYEFKNQRFATLKELTRMVNCSKYSVLELNN